jgi:hypothetical protein
MPGTHRPARLAVDFGTATTVAVLAETDGRIRPLPALPSGVYADADGTLLVGAPAERAGRADPDRFEPYPKRHIGEPEVRLGGVGYPVVDLVAAVLRRVAADAGPARSTVLTHPASWSTAQREVLLDAAKRAGLDDPELVPEPIAAARYFANAVRPVPAGHCLLAYDLGAGGLRIGVLRCTGTGFELVDSAELDDAGGLAFDELLVQVATDKVSGVEYRTWQRVVEPTDPADRRYRLELSDRLRAAREALSTSPSARLRLPLLDRETHLSREELDRAITPALRRPVEITRSLVRETEIAEVLLVGGASRVPLAATLLQGGLGVAPTVVDSPESAVAEGALVTAPAAHAPAPTGETPREPAERVVFTPSAAATGNAIWYVFVAFALAVGVLVFSNSQRGQLATKLWLRDSLHNLSLGLALLFLALLAYAVVQRLRPVLVVSEHGITVNGRDGSAELPWDELIGVDFSDGTLWVRPVPGSDLRQRLGRQRRWDPERGAARVIALTDVNAEPDSVYAAVTAHSRVPVTVEDD